MDKISLIGKNDGEVLHIANGQYRTIISGDQTDGRYAVIEMNVPPGAGPTPHSHKDIEEVFYVTNGEIEFRSENVISKAITGDTIRVPKGGAVHAFKNTTNSEATLICTVYPSGLEKMFVEVNASDPSKAKTIGEKFGNKFYPIDYFDEKL